MYADDYDIVAEVVQSTPFWFETLFTDSKNRLLYVCQPQNDGSFDEINGPALTSYKYGNSDTVMAVRCKSWPENEDEWPRRRSLYNWPSTKLVEQCKSLGCLYVPVRNSGSVDQLLEWRKSFTHQERLLVTHFNSVQLKCLILLKLIKNDIIEKRLKQKSITSYHCKVCMLYMVANTPETLWIPTNLVLCLSSSLNMMFLWIESGIFPSYFIPGANLMHGRIYGAVRFNCIKLLQEIVANMTQILLQIHSDDIGQRLQKLPCISIEDGDTRIERIIGFHLDKAIDILTFRNVFLKQHFKTLSEEFLTDLVLAKQDLQSLDTMLGHTKEQLQKVIAPKLPFIDLAIMSTFVAVSHKQNLSRSVMRKYILCENWNEIARRTDPFSSRLKQATYLYTLGYFEEALIILNAMKVFRQVSPQHPHGDISPSGLYFDSGTTSSGESGEANVSTSKQSDCEVKYPLRNCLPICACEPYQKVIPDTETLLCAEVEATTVVELFSRYLTACVIFLPTEADLIPQPLRYEMIRSWSQPSNSRHCVCYWYDWAVADGNFLSLFLKYLNHKELNMHQETVSDINNMELLVKSSKISHCETALNLLGWIYKENGQRENALRCFCDSIDILPNHNAALWHLKSIEDSAPTNESGDYAVIYKRKSWNS